MSTPAYALTLEQVAELADAISELDGLAGYCIATRKSEIKALASRCHEHLIGALGEDEAKVYGMNPEAA